MRDNVCSKRVKVKRFNLWAKPRVKSCFFGRKVTSGRRNRDNTLEAIEEEERRVGSSPVYEFFFFLRDNNATVSRKNDYVIA